MNDPQELDRVRAVNQCLNKQILELTRENEKRIAEKAVKDFITRMRLSEIGDALGLQAGEDIPTSILPGIIALKTQLESVEAALNQLQSRGLAQGK